MSPEQLRDGRDVDIRTDVYAIGVMAYELIAGTKPVDLKGHSLPAAIRALETGSPRRVSSFDPKTRGDIETIIAKAIEKDPGNRYETAMELGSDIRPYLADEPVRA